ncbi:hypothetical protein B0J15DRAFT_466063, partial [Fusarium solani]
MAVAEMEPFIKLPEFPFIICKTCHYAYIGKHIEQHMKQYHRSIRVAERNEITKAIQSDPDVIQTPAELATWPTPPPTTDPIPFIHPPQSDKLGCGEEGCLYVVGSERAMQNHYRSDHGWTNPRGRGGSVQKRAMETQQVPWRSGVQCQRFFSNGPGSRWFEVGFGAP